MLPSNAHTITVAIPSRNRPQQLRGALASARLQHGIQLDLVVINDASDQGVEELNGLRNEPSLRWIDNQLPLGWYNNRRRAFAQNQSTYFAVLSDDNRLAPGHLASCIRSLEAHPNAAFAVAASETRQLEALEDPWPVEAPETVQPLVGIHWLSQLVHSDAQMPDLSAVVFRSAALAGLGEPPGLGSRHGADRRLLLELATHHDVLLLPHLGARIGEHNARARRQEFDGLPGCELAVGELEVAELIASLLNSEPHLNEQQRRELSTRLHLLAQRQLQLFASFLPMLVETEWEQRLLREQHLADLLPPRSDGVIVVRDDHRRLALPGVRQWPFLERDGRWNGNPANDAEAIAELERLRMAGASAIVFLETAVWQLEHYSGFKKHLYSRYELLSERADLVLFNLKGKSP